MPSTFTVAPSYITQLLPTQITLKVISANGMCSYGVGNTGNYTSMFSKRDIKDQVYSNPAGQFDYIQLVNQAKMQTYVITELFDTSSTCISKSLFSLFLPHKTFPTTDFLNAPPPVDSNPISG